MLFPRRASLHREAYSYCILLSICAVTLVHHFWTTTTTIYQNIQYLHLQDAQPPDSNSIPKVIWYKLGPKGLNKDTQEWTDSCITANPQYEAQFLTDEDADDFVKTAFVNRPDILEAYLGLTVPILKADLLRYMLLFDQGGVWSDLDVSCSNIPIDDWIPSRYVDDAGVVVGLEFDVGWASGIIRQFASWTFMAKPGSPHMLTVIEDIVEALQSTMQEYQVPVENVTVAMTGDVVDFSGPRRLTTGILRSLGYKLNRTVDQDEVSEILQPKMIGDVLVMPGRSFAASANRYPVEQEEQLPPSLVTHHYAGTWKNVHGGESL